MPNEIPLDIRDRLQARLVTGAYQSEAEVLRDALDALDCGEQDKLLRWNERNRLAAQQSRQGLSKPLDDEHVIARLRARLASEGIID